MFIKPHNGIKLIAEIDDFCNYGHACDALAKDYAEIMTPTEKHGCQSEQSDL
ncbi:MAG: hypothetical protein JEZ07_01050 [Phycisphaerae bacterium]|nr:hypothetical protein [Phycisphaerae bacterium]